MGRRSASNAGATSLREDVENMKKYGGHKVQSDVSLEDMDSRMEPVALYSPRRWEPRRFLNSVPFLVGRGIATSVKEKAV